MKKRVGQIALAVVLAEAIWRFVRAFTWYLHSRLHQSLIEEVAKNGAQYHVLILKTKLAIPGLGLLR